MKKEEYPPVQWADVKTAWQSLSPVSHSLLGTLIVVSTLGWLVMSLLPVLNLSWWLAHGETPFRVRWIVWKTVLWLLSAVSICGFITWARGKRDGEVGERQGWAQKTVLIVGKDARLFGRAADALEKAGFRTEIVGSGEQALDSLARGGIDLTIAAEMMQPDVYGDAFLKTLRKTYPTVPIFTFDEPLLSPDHGYDERFPGHKDFPEDPREEGRSLYYFLHREGYRGDVYLTPPVNPKELVVFVRRVLEDSGSDA